MLKRLVREATRAKNSSSDEASGHREARGAAAMRSRQRAAPSSSSETEEKMDARRAVRSKQRGRRQVSSSDSERTDREAKAASQSTRKRAGGGHRGLESETDVNRSKPAPHHDTTRVKNTRKNTFSWDIGKAFARKQSVQETDKAATSSSSKAKKHTKTKTSEDTVEDDATDRGNRQSNSSRRTRAVDVSTHEDGESEAEVEKATRRTAKAHRGKRRSERSASVSCASASEDSEPHARRRKPATRTVKSRHTASRRAMSSTESDQEPRPKHPKQSALKATASLARERERDARVELSSSTDARKTRKKTQKKRNERLASTQSTHSRRRTRWSHASPKARPTQRTPSASVGPEAGGKHRVPHQRPQSLRRRTSAAHDGGESTSSADSDSSGLDADKLRSLTKRPGSRDDDASSDQRPHCFSDDEYAVRLKRSLRRAFDFFDLDQSDAIEKKELGHVLRALGHELTTEELDAEMARADVDQSGQLDFPEFVAFVTRQLARKQFVLSPRREMELRLAFQSLDRDQNGALDEQEFEFFVYKVLGVELSVEEQDALLDFVDANSDGSIHESEFIAFMKVMEQFQEQQQQQPLERVDGPSRLAMRAMKKLNRGAPVDLDRNLLAFFGVPTNFRPAISSATTCRALTGNSLAHVLSFPSPHVVVALAQNDPRRQQREAGDELRLLQQAESYQAQAIVSLKRAVGVPKPFDTREDDVVKRCVHVCLFQEREERHGPTTTTTETGRRKGDAAMGALATGGGAVVGNVHEIPVHWQASEEDVWTFSKKATKQDKYKFLVRTNAVNDHLYVLVEFIVHLRMAPSRAKTNRRAASRHASSPERQETREMVCCWCKLPVRTLLAKRADVHRSQERLWGGTAHAPVDIEQDEVLRRRTGWRALTTVFKAPVPPGIGIKSVPVERFSDDVQRSVRSLPATIIAPFLSLPVLAEYMAVMTHTLSRSAGSSAGAGVHEPVRWTTPVILTVLAYVCVPSCAGVGRVGVACEPVLKLLPRIVDDHEALTIFRRVFDVEMASFKSVEVEYPVQA